MLIHQVPVEQIPHIYIACGTEDGLIAAARELAGILMEKDLPFDYMQMAGRHNGPYWIQSVGRIIGVQHEVMRRALGERPVAGGDGVGGPTRYRTIVISRTISGQLRIRTRPSPLAAPELMWTLR